MDRESSSKHGPSLTVIFNPLLGSGRVAMVTLRLVAIMKVVYSCVAERPVPVVHVVCRFAEMLFSVGTSDV